MTPKRTLARARVQIRRSSSRWRILPDFLIIGAQRCGTSSLYKYLSHHPDIIGSIRKETEFFSINFGLGEDWYRAHFPSASWVSVVAAKRGRRPSAFEASPGYLLDHRAPQRVATALPQARLVVMLRNPVDRAFSQYQHNRRLNQERLTFEAALEAEECRLSAEHERLAADPAYPARSLQRYSYVARGLYADQLTRWFAYFPRQRFFVIKSEDFFKDTAKALSSLLEFLGVPDWSPVEFRNFSYRGSQPDSEGVPMATRRRLADRFWEPNQRLARLLGHEMGWDG